MDSVQRRRDEARQNIRPLCHAEGEGHPGANLTHGVVIDERPNPQAPRFFVLGILAINLHCPDLLRLNISLGIQIKIHLSSFASAL